MPIRMLAGLLCFVVGGTAVGEDVPEWFRGRADDPYWVFSAWKQLSTRDASLAVSPRWGTIGCVLRDRKGRPIPNCPLRVEHGGSPGGDYSVNVMTDAEGRFIVYGTIGRPMTERERADEEKKRAGESERDRVRRTFSECMPKGFHFLAARGYPTSTLGRAFAHDVKAWRECRVGSSVEEGPDWFFCRLTCDEEESFDKAAFEAFARKDAARPIQPERSYRYDAQPRAARPPGVEKEYPIQVIGPNGEPIEDARIRYHAHDGRKADNSSLATDSKGKALLKADVLTSEPGEPGVRRSLSLDVAGGVVGPIDIELVSEQLNVIRVPKPATVRGRVVDWHGEPLHAFVFAFDGVRYAKPNQLTFELDLLHGGGGRFEFARVMPGQPFRLQYSPSRMWNATPCHTLVTPLLSAVSEEMTLEPGEVREGIELVVRPAAAVRGVVLDEQGNEVEDAVIEHSRPYDFGEGWTGWDLIGENGPNHGFSPKPKGPRFGDDGLGAWPVKYRARAAGHRPLEVGPIELEPGELRFVKIVLPKSS